ncbi:MAG: hypothetical protein H6700_08160 [Myxococcales bacterium]|nr:hypothetical protein [Myxococcales bacterium]MCB9531724.1 hypothetical protein [Myxococcales bacterium]
MLTPNSTKRRALIAAAALAIVAGGCNESVECLTGTEPSCGEDAGVDGVSGDAGTDTTDADNPDALDSGDDGTDATPDAPDVPPDPDDADGDGIPDDVEGEDDADGDGIPNYLDDDSDGDGVLDSVETDRDTDFDTIPDYLDDDSDDDGFPDSVEGGGDFDGDGLPDSSDRDSDGDGIDDIYEGDVDTDLDGAIDRLDLDSDGDTIPDRWETADDFDEDGIPNFRDLDSDNDGHPDALEYGVAPGTDARPANHDGDPNPDFIDLDSDGDTLGDDIELGCPDSTDRLLADSDDDGIRDVLEVAFGSDEDDIGQACDPTRDISDDVDFYFELPYLDPAGEQQDELNFDVDVRYADVAFNMDTTGSMGGEISALQASLTSVIIPALEAELDDAAYAVTQFDDFPCGGFGAGSDRPLILRQRVTTDAAAAQRGVQALEQHGGSDYFESGIESIFQICAGVGRDDDCIGGAEVPPFDPAAGFVDGVADGEIGGVGFRDGSLPIIVHITDAPSHAKGEDAYPYGASRSEAFAAMRSIGAKLIGVASGTDARSDLEQAAIRAGSVVQACAWTDPDTGVRPFGCAAGMCCTGGSGAGRAPAAGGVCPLVYDIGGSGSGMDSSIVSGIQALVNFAAFDLTTRPRADEEELAATGIDTSTFISRVVPVSAVAPDTGCSSVPEVVDRNRDGVPDFFLGVSPGSQLLFDVFVYNDEVEQVATPRVFTAYIDVVQQGGAILDTQIVTVLVPPVLKP